MTPVEAPEFCFLAIDRWYTCMSKTEWSGWVQAVGSVAAILVVVGIQPWMERRRQRLAAREAAKNAAKLGYGIVAIAGALLENGLFTDRTQIHSHLSMVRSLTAGIESLSFGAMTLREAAAARALHGIGLDLLEALPKFQGEFPAAYDALETVGRSEQHGNEMLKLLPGGVTTNS